MHFRELIKSRYSVREYHENKVNRTLIQEVVNAARLAPSAANKQPWHFIAVDDDKMLNKVKDAYDRDWFKGAPCVIVVFGNHQDSWKRSYDQKDHCDIDVAIAIDHLTLMSTQLGLGTCWICHFKKDVIEEIFPSPEYMEPVALIAIGYPVVNRVPEKKRKALEEVLSFNKY